MKSLEMREKQAAKEERQKEKKIETSVEKLRKLLKEEKRLKKRRKRSTSSSSSCDSSSDESTSSSSSSSSSDHKKLKKRDRNRSESSRSSKHTPRSSLNQNRRDDCYSPPANTSASFLNQKHEMEKLLEKQDRLGYHKPEVRSRHHSLSRTFADDEEAYGGRSEDSRDSYSSSKTQAHSSKTEKQGKVDRVPFDRRDSSGPYRRKSDDRNKTHYSGMSEKDVGRKDPYQKHSPSQTKYCVSPAGSDYSTKSAEHYRRYTSRWINESSQYSADSRPQLTRSQREREPKSGEREDTKTKEGDEEATLNGREQSGGGARKNLPQNLLNIFNQIAEFEREKGSKQKNQ